MIDWLTETQQQALHLAQREGYVNTKQGIPWQSIKALSDLGYLQIDMNSSPQKPVRGKTRWYSDYTYILTDRGKEVLKDV